MNMGYAVPCTMYQPFNSCRGETNDSWRLLQVTFCRWHP
jgi:hypothetical protein